MHIRALEAVIESVRKRVAQGDHPTDPAHSVELLEEAVLQLAAATTAQAQSEKDFAARWHPDARLVDDLASEVDRLRDRLATAEKERDWGVKRMAWYSDELNKRAARWQQAFEAVKALPRIGFNSQRDSTGPFIRRAAVLALFDR